VTAARSGRLCLGFQYATPYPDPGPPPRRPTPPEQERVSPDWAEAQRREERRLNRPLRAAFAAAVTVTVLAVVGGLAGWFSSLLAGFGVIAGLLLAGVSGYALWQGARALRTRTRSPALARTSPTSAR